MLACGETHEPVQSTAVQEMKAQRRRDAVGDGALARCGRPIDRDNGRVGHHAAARREIEARTSKYAGNVLRTHSGPLMRTRMPPSAASEKHMAMR